jgi:bacillithiol synthase
MDVASLPFFSPLVKDYIARFESSRIHEFFAVAPEPSHEEMRALIDARLVRERTLAKDHRAAVVKCIRKTADDLGVTSLAYTKNLELLAATDTLAVVTGQQLGILGGPLYSFYKAFTAIQLAKKLSEQHAPLSFVPVFWLEGEDHDFEEIASINVLNADSQLTSVRYHPSAIPSGEEKNWKKQVGPILLEEAALNAMFEELRVALPPTDFTNDIIALARECYASGRTLQDAFALLMAKYFAKDGLLLFDAGTPEMKALGAPLFRKEIETSPQMSERVVLQSGELEESYFAQVKPRAINLFYITDDGDRLSIIEHEPTAGKTERTFFLKGSRKTLTYEEISNALDNEPWRFSPNVVLRPVYQDWLLPTVSYVAGPGEISYFAQFRPAYEWASIPMPLVRPRASATIIEERFERVFAKFKITAEEILLDGRGRNTALFDQIIASDLAPAFAEALEKVDAALENLRGPVQRAEPTLDGALTSLKGKMLTTLRDFEGKTLSAERKRHTTTKTQLDKLLAALLPSDELQERKLNLFYFLNKYGPDFPNLLKQALSEIALDFREHHLLHMAQLATSGAQTGELPLPAHG